MAHVVIDNHSRVSFALVRVDGCSHSGAQFLHPAVASRISQGVAIDQVMTDAQRASAQYGHRRVCRQAVAHSCCPANAAARSREPGKKKARLVTEPGFVNRASGPDERLAY